MRVRNVVAAACLLLTADAAWARDVQPDERVLGRDDLEFVEALAADGYGDLAARLLDLLVERRNIDPARLAYAFDVCGAALVRDDPGSAETLWLNAADLYATSVAPQVAGEVAPQPDRLREVADRLFVFGLHFNRVPATRVSFVDWRPTQFRRGESWRKAVPIYEAALAAKSDDRTAIQLARTYGFLTDWPNAARVYAGLFERNPVLTKTRQKLDRELISAKPELTLAYLEWGVAEQEQAHGVADERKYNVLLNHCISDVLFPLSVSVRADSNPEVFWGAMYHVVTAYMDKGLYNDAQLKVEDLMRSVGAPASFDDDAYGYRTLFTQLIDELRRVPRRRSTWPR